MYAAVDVITDVFSQVFSSFSVGADCCWGFGFGLLFSASDEHSLLGGVGRW